MLKKEKIKKHLTELRKIIIYYSIILFSFSVISLSFSDKIINFIIKIIKKNIKNKYEIITNSPYEIMVLQFKISLYIGFILALPFFFYLLWKFIAPGLFSKEKKIFLYSYIFAFFLLLTGLLFSYYLVLPFLFNFFLNNINNEIKVLLSISLTSNFIINIIMIFSIIFLIPVIIVILNSINIINIETLLLRRKQFIIFSFIIGAIFTPSDVFSQFLLAIPIIILYELSIIILKFIKKIS